MLLQLCTGRERLNANLTSSWAALFQQGMGKPFETSIEEQPASCTPGCGAPIKSLLLTTLLPGDFSLCNKEIDFNGMMGSPELGVRSHAPNLLFLGKSFHLFVWLPCKTSLRTLRHNQHPAYRRALVLDRHLTLLLLLLISFRWGDNGRPPAHFKGSQKDDWVNGCESSLISVQMWGYGNSTCSKGRIHGVKDPRSHVWSPSCQVSFPSGLQRLDA